jgi:hypothetical protein
MKKSIFLLITLSLLFAGPAASQGLLKKVTGAMKDELTGTNKSGNTKNQGPEPACACDAPEAVFNFGGNQQLNYTETTICSKADGSLLFQDRMTGNYYVAKGNVTQGPFPAGDPHIAGYSCDESASSGIEGLLVRYKEFISKSGDKYLISFGGKTYGPYAQIGQFGITRSKDKFAAVVVENIPVSADEGKKMDEAIEKAKTDQEKMELAMQYTQQMQQKMMQGGGPGSMTPKLVTNIPGATFSPITGGTFSADMKYDDILVIAFDKILDLQGNIVMTLKPELAGANKILVNSTNTKYAVYNYGNILFSDNTTLNELFNPYLMKADGKIYLTYMYYSPKRNAIMQCKIPF